MLQMVLNLKLLLNGIDVLRLLGNNISVSANNVASLGDPNG